MIRIVAGLIVLVACNTKEAPKSQQAEGSNAANAPVPFDAAAPAGDAAPVVSGPIIRIKGKPPRVGAKLVFREKSQMQMADNRSRITAEADWVIRGKVLRTAQGFASRVQLTIDSDASHTTMNGQLAPLPPEDERELIVTATGVRTRGGDVLEDEHAKLMQMIASEIVGSGDSLVRHVLSQPWQHGSVAPLRAGEMTVMNPPTSDGTFTPLDGDIELASVEDRIATFTIHMRSKYQNDNGEMMRDGAGELRVDTETGQFVRLDMSARLTGSSRDAFGTITGSAQFSWEVSWDK